MKLSNSGFTLVEVLVSLLILVVVLGSGLELFNTIIKGEQHIRDKTVANWVAQNYLVQQQIEEKWPELGELSYQTVMGGKQWYIRAETSNTDDDSFRKTHIHVMDNKENGERLADLFSFNAKEIRW
jgi:general secretion pathway protein I